MLSNVCHAQVPKYDTHVVYVHLEAPPVRQEGPHHVPCPPDRWAGPAPVYLELVVFESAAILPRFILALSLPD
jgi:hypothetical protein